MGHTAMILAAGRGERMRPLSDATAKPALPLLGRALLLRLLDRLQAGGVDRLAVNLHHRPEGLRGLLDPVPEGLAALHLSDESERLLGTGGGVRRALPFLREGGGPVVVANGDALADLDVAALLEAHGASGAGATLVLVEADLGRYGAVRESGGRVTGFDRLEAGGEGRPLVFAGIQVLDPALLERLPADEPSDLVRDLYAVMLREGRLPAAFVHEGRWAEIGDPRLFRDLVLDAARGADEQGESWIGAGPPPAPRDGARLLAAPETDASHGVMIEGAVVLESGATATEGSWLEDSVLLPGADVGPGARIVRTVLGPGAFVAPGLELQDVVAVDDPDPAADPPRGVRREGELWLRDLETAER